MTTCFSATLVEVPTELRGARFVLRAPQPGDGAALHAAVLETLQELQQWMPWAHAPMSVEHNEAEVRRMSAEFTLRQDLPYLIWAQGEGGHRSALLGSVALRRMDWALRKFELGYWLRRSSQGQGLASEAVRLLAGMAFSQLQARRVEIRMDERNVGSRAVAERCGFEFEGLLRRDHLGVDQQPRDTRVYALLSAPGAWAQASA
ncbi:GNAT family N-acetyltransferase [Roseateles sp. BYS180W]|uniref:GNAT family N-acetyltransferase n=1 Tax=Roseateles rivi TaxID=3299028 RepID=A0ABW7FXM0_9BURK